MNTSSSGSVLKTILAVIAAVFGIGLLIGGIYLAVLGGSWYYIIAGILFIATAVLCINEKVLHSLFMPYSFWRQWCGGCGKSVQISLHLRRV